jgi:hypothetical protein
VTVAIVSTATRGSSTTPIVTQTETQTEAPTSTLPSTSAPVSNTAAVLSVGAEVGSIVGAIVGFAAVVVSIYYGQKQIKKHRRKQQGIPIDA